MHIVLNKVLTGIVVWQMSDVYTLLTNLLIYRIGYEGMVFWQPVHLIHCYL
jgi:hypothetical protein